MTELEVIAIEHACERIVLDSVGFVDGQAYEALAALFVPDGILTRPNGDRIIGPAAILKAYTSRPGGRITRHVVSNIRVTVESLNRALSLSYALVYSAPADGPADGAFGVQAEPRHLVGEFEDEFVRTPEGWRFALRRARFVMHT